MEIVADTAVGPWVAFELFEKLKVDSARWDGGERRPWCGARRARCSGCSSTARSSRATCAPSASTTTGDLIDRIVDFFLIKSSAAWYPRSLEGRSLAKFDLSFTTGAKYLLASVGDRVDSSASGRTVRTRWVTPGPDPERVVQSGAVQGV